MSTDRPICVLVAALGGQGGGVLADWLVAAARLDGLQAQATSIPGVAQRTGATTYYFEVYPQRGLSGRPVFSIYPASGAVDLLVSFEPMEAARALSGGLVGPETTVITARDRVFSTAEKIKPGDGTVSAAPVLDALRSCAATMSAVDMGRLAQGAGCHPNAVMYGAMVASGVLPMRLESCSEAITLSGVAVERNLAGFEAGMTARNSPADAETAPKAAFRPAPDAFASAVAALPAPVRRMAGHAAAHLLDYQGPAYAERYFRRLESIVALDSATQDHRLSVLVARRLAAWMAFEDVIRVAALKTRPGRLARIRGELGVGDEAPLAVHDYLRPGREEMQGILPAWLGKLLPAPHDGKFGTGLALKLPTSSPLGWLTLRLLAALRPWRRFTARFKHEQEMIERWLQAIGEAAAADYELACRSADLAVWVRGYGDTRRRGMRRLSELLAGWSQRVTRDRAGLNDAVGKSLVAAYSDPDTEVAQ
ncbi:MAG: indolepyruvate oxidoreductase subunit beta family protein [Paracoccaceae bacterium]